MPIYRIAALRKIVLPILKAVSRDTNYSHPWVDGSKVSLNSFKHKGYWYHGRKREQETMELFKKIIQVDHNVVEVGGHIGFITIWFDSLTSPAGQVFVFEPGSNNLPYIRRNVSTLSKVKLIEKAVGAEIGTIDFYEDDLTGQNNSVVEDFEGLKKNAAKAYVESSVKKVTVPITTLDHEFESQRIDFIKIDIEGGEWGAICGALKIIQRDTPAMMVEVQADEPKIFNKFNALGYVMFSEAGKVTESPSDLFGNIFCLHTVAHQDLILSLLPDFTPSDLNVG